MKQKQRIFSLFLLVALVFSLAAPVSAAGEMNFTDVAPDDWYYTYVKDLYDNDIVHGTTPTTFSPQGQVTLGEALKLVLMSAGYGDQTPTGSHWASGFYQLAQENGFLPSGLSLGLNDPINRLQIAEIIVNVLDLSRTSHDPSPFADTEDLSALILYDHGIFQGNQVNGELLFQPQDHITRAEITTVIWRVYELKNQTPEEPEEPDNPPDLPEEPEEPEEPTGDYFYFGGKKVYVVEEMPKRTYDSSLFQVNENGFLTYDSDKYTSKIGIDVSRYQGSIDWAAVKDAGVEFAMLRLGYRGYGTGAIVRDSYFYQNIQGALENGIEVGVYFFSQAINEAEAVEEAQFCMDLLQDYSITYPIVFDWEPYDSSLHPRTEGLSDEMLTKCAVAFCQAVEANGYDSMVYSNLTYFYLHYDLSKLVDFPLWLAQYNKTPTFYYHFDMWQYSSTGKVPGIEGNVDLNIQMIPKTYSVVSLLKITARLRTPLRRAVVLCLLIEPSKICPVSKIPMTGGLQCLLVAVWIGHTGHPIARLIGGLGRMDSVLKHPSGFYGSPHLCPGMVKQGGGPFIHSQLTTGVHCVQQRQQACPPEPLHHHRPVCGSGQNSGDSPLPEGLQKLLCAGLAHHLLTIK